MKNRYLLLLLVILVSAGVKAQINYEDSTVQAVTYWDKNESYTYEIIQDTDKSKDGGDVKTESVRSVVQVSVIDSTETFYTIEWRFLQHDIPNLDLVPELKSLLDKKRYIYRMSILGEIEELLNWEEVRDNTLETIKVGLNTALQAGNVTQSDSLTNLMNTFTSDLMTKDYVEQKVIEPVQIFHTFFGLKYKLGEAIESEIDIPIPVENVQNAKALASMWLDSIDEENATYTLYYEQTIDREALRNIVSKALEGMSDKLNLAFKSEDIKDAFSQKFDNSSSVYSMFDNTGWPLDIIGKTNISIADAQQNKTIRIRMIDND